MRKWLAMWLLKDVLCDYESDFMVLSHRIMVLESEVSALTSCYHAEINSLTNLMCDANVRRSGETLQ